MKTLLAAGLAATTLVLHPLAAAPAGASPAPVADCRQLLPEAAVEALAGHGVDTGYTRQSATRGSQCDYSDGGRSFAAFCEDGGGWKTFVRTVRYGNQDLHRVKVRGARDAYAWSVTDHAGSYGVALRGADQTFVAAELVAPGPQAVKRVVTSMLERAVAARPGGC